MVRCFLAGMCFGCTGSTSPTLHDASANFAQKQLGCLAANVMVHTAELKCSACKHMPILRCSQNIIGWPEWWVNSPNQAYFFIKLAILTDFRRKLRLESLA